MCDHFKYCCFCTFGTFTSLENTSIYIIEILQIIFSCITLALGILTKANFTLPSGVGDSLDIFLYEIFNWGGIIPLVSGIVFLIYRFVYICCINKSSNDDGGESGPAQSLTLSKWKNKIEGYVSLVMLIYVIGFTIASICFIFSKLFFWIMILSLIGYLVLIGIMTAIVFHNNDYFQAKVFKCCHRRDIIFESADLHYRMHEGVREVRYKNGPWERDEGQFTNVTPSYNIYRGDKIVGGGFGKTYVVRNQ